ncbi:kinesin-like protein KIF24 isoform X2 [Channa argus]
MTRCLYECLKAVSLQHHYARFTSMGVCRATHLSSLTMEDYTKLGVHTMEDRTQLFRLVKMVKNDQESFVYDDYDDEFADEGYSVLDSSFTYKASGDDDDYNDAAINKQNGAPFVRPSCICRQLDFSYETTDPQLCGSKRNNTGRTHSHNHLSDNQTDSRPDFKRGISTHDSNTRLLSKCFSFHKPKPRPARVTSKRFNNKQGGHKDRKHISRKEKLCKENGSNETSGHMSTSTPVYESKRTADYNYGLPNSSPPALNKRRAGDQRISVCVRKRPLTHAESRRGQTDVVTALGGECVIVNESKESVDLTQYILQHRFYFDHVFGEESSNEDVYQRTAYPLVQHMLSGGKATCFAYGQTGAGKTHTMLGSSPRRPGLYALAVRDIFAYLSTTHTHSPLLVYVSFFEIYCGQLYDLLDHRKRLFAREDGQKVVHIAGLRYVRVDSVSSMLEVILQGTEERTQGMSGVNPLSSRSHALLQIQLRGSNQEVAGKMWFVDLAGSERASDAKEPDRQNRMVGAEINQSLLALKECIRSLDQEQSHTPFRQSKLTQVLKDSFVGDSVTCMIANISPGHLATEHTLNTLRYADRVKELRGQGGERGGKRSKTSSFLKHNISNSRRSPPKKAKLTRQTEASGPTAPTQRLPMERAVLCSTPKNSRRGEETSARDKKGVGIEHTTPVRGLLGTGDKKDRADKGKGRGGKNDKCGGTENQSLRYQNSRTGLVLGQSADGQLHLREVQGKERAQEGNLSFSSRESVFFHREKENQQSTLKGVREEKAGLVEQQIQAEISKDLYGEVGRQNKRHLQKDYERQREKERHLRWYHQQLQQFMPSTASSSFHLCSNFQFPSFSSSLQTSVSPSLSFHSCSSYQQSSHLSDSALVQRDLEEILDAYRAKVHRGQLPFPSGEICLQPETSLSYNERNYQDPCGNSGGTKARLGKGRVVSEKKKSENATGKAIVRKGNERPAGIEGGERRWAWVSTRDAEHADRITGEILNNIEGQISLYDSEDRGELDKEGLNASEVPTNGVWNTEEEGEADSSGIMSIQSNNDSNSLFNHPPLESPQQRPQAERPFSPACENPNTRLTPNKSSDISFESKHNRCTSNNLPSPQAVPSTSHTRNRKCLDNYAIRRPFFNGQSPTQTCTTVSQSQFYIPQTGCKIPTEPFNKQPENSSYTRVQSHLKVKTKLSVLPQDEKYAESLYIMDPLSLLQVDQRVATASFFQGQHTNASVCLLGNEIRADNRKNIEEDNLTCVEMVGNFVEDEDAELRLSILELPQTETQCSPLSDNLTAINTGQRKDTCFATNEHCGISRNKGPIPEVMLILLKDQDNIQTPQTMPVIEMLGSKPNPCIQTSVIQIITPSVQDYANIGSTSSYSLIPNDTTKMPPQYPKNIEKKTDSFISPSPSKGVLERMNTVPSQCNTKPNSPTEPNGQERSDSNQQIRPIVHFSTLEDLDHSQWCVVQAHWEQLEEMEALCYKEGLLLCQQPYIAFGEYIHTLEKIMERKAQCVHSMRAQLQPYLKPKQSNQSHNEGEDKVMMFF